MHKKLSPQQLYNASESGLYWRCLPTKISAQETEKIPSGFKDVEDKATVLDCSNANSAHKTKLVVIGEILISASNRWKHSHSYTMATKRDG